MGLTFVEEKPAEKTREPEQWKNRWRLKAIGVRLECLACGEQKMHTHGEEFLTPHCTHWPSKYLAEDMASMESEDWQQLTDYLGAIRVD